MVDLKTLKYSAMVLLIVTIIPFFIFTAVSYAKEPVIHEDPENITEKESDILLALVLGQVESLSAAVYDLSEEDLVGAMTNFNGFQKSFSIFDEIVTSSNISEGEYVILHNGFKTANIFLSEFLPLV